MNLLKPYKNRTYKVSSQNGSNMMTAIYLIKIS